jgi:hypothetical protein
MAEIMRGSAAARRAAHALVHSLGATCMQLQVPALPLADDDGEELGLRSPEFQLQMFAPVAIRRRNGTTEVLVPADVIEEGLGVQGDGAVRAAVAAASGVQIGDELYVLQGIETVSAACDACLFRFLLQQPATEVV